MQFLQKIIDQGKRVFIFLGEAGSGKSEIALNWALILATSGKPVRFFDMDQTKPLFRSRELIRFLKQRQIFIDEYCQVLDSPTIPSGVFDRIQDPETYVILDIGGNAAGARSIGQLCTAWSNAVAAYMVVNCYRPFSGSQKDLLITMESIMAAARLDTIQVVSSPNFGEQTTLEDVLVGHRQTEKLLGKTRYYLGFLAVLKNLEQDVQAAFPAVDIFGITRYIKAPWEEEFGRIVQGRDKHGQDYH